MNGAESLVRTLLASGVTTCFANPGTSEMHFVAALDSHPEMHCVLCLFEGGTSGAAGWPAAGAGSAGFWGSPNSPYWDSGDGGLGPTSGELEQGGFGFVTLIHEFGHGLLCKHFGGECHEMGVMFLVFTPLPYVDASSAWALRNKWHRVIIGTSGMMVELAIASVAALVRAVEWTLFGGRSIDAAGYRRCRETFRTVVPG